MQNVSWFVAQNHNSAKSADRSLVLSHAVLPMPRMIFCGSMQCSTLTSHDHFECKYYCIWPPSSDDAKFLNLINKQVLQYRPIVINNSYQNIFGLTFAIFGLYFNHLLGRKHNKYIVINLHWAKIRYIILVSKGTTIFWEIATLVVISTQVLLNDDEMDYFSIHYFYPEM